MKKILVTGATGFIGNYVVSELLAAGHKVVATSANREKAQKFSWFKRVEYIPLDFAEVADGNNYFNFFGQPDILIHLAWEGLPNYKSLFHFEQNLPRHYTFLRNIILNGCRDITVAGTCFEYGFQEGKLSEELPAQPANPYGVAKDSLHKFLNQLQKDHPFSMKWVRFFYLYGKGQNAKSLFSQLDAAIAEHQETFNMSGGQQVRDYLPVETAASYLVRIALQTTVLGTINCCSGKGVTVQQMVENYLKEKGQAISLNLGYYGYPDYEPMSFWGDDRKLQMILHD